jgi:hypothetical protein
MAEANLHEYKMQFARLLQRVDKSTRLQYAHQIAKQIVGKENATKYTQYILQIGDEWPHDPEVIEEIDRLDSIPKTRERFLLELWSKATSPTIEPKEQIQALKLYGMTMKFIGGGEEDSQTSEQLHTFQQMFDAVTNPAKT